MVAQRDGGLVQVAPGGIEQVQADEVDHAVTRLLQLGPQKLAAKVAGNLHHALGRIGIDGGQLVGTNHAMLDAIGQRLFKERAGVV